jgi:site-specific DNA recombinase
MAQTPVGRALCEREESMKPTTTERTTVALYVRVSTEEQAQGGFSIAGQTEKLQLACQLHDWRALTPYVDDGYSGKNFDRPAMKRMIADAKKGLFSLIIVYKLDRLSRKLSDLVTFGEELERMKIGIRSVTEAMDTSTSAGKLLFNLLGSFAQFEREMISERTKMGLGRRKKEGKWNGLPPFGYRTKKDGTLELDPKDAPFARRVFELFLKENLGSKNIARQLRREDRCTRRKGAWARNSVWNMLVAPAYAGFYRVEDQLIKAPHEGIITKSQFDEIQGILAGRDRAKNYNTSPNVLVGLIRCGLCGSTMTTGNGKGNYYYHCTGRGRDNKCEQVWIPARDVEAEVIRDIGAAADDSAMIDRLIKNRHLGSKKEAQALNAERLSVGKQLEAAERDKDKQARWLLDNLPEKRVAEEMGRQLRTRMDEIEALKLRQKELAAKAESLETESFNAGGVAEFLRNFGKSLPTLSVGQKRIVIQALVREVIVRSKDDCEVVLTVPSRPSMPHPLPGTKKAGPLDEDRPWLNALPGLKSDSRFASVPQMG